MLLNYLVAAVANGAWILSREFLTTSAARGGLLTERQFEFDFTKQPDYKIKMQHKMATDVGLTQFRKFAAAASMWRDSIREPFEGMIACSSCLDSAGKVPALAMQLALTCGGARRVSIGCQQATHAFHALWGIPVTQFGQLECQGTVSLPFAYAFQVIMAGPSKRIPIQEYQLHRDGAYIQQ